MDRTVSTLDYIKGTIGLLLFLFLPLAVVIFTIIAFWTGEWRWLGFTAVAATGTWLTWHR
jgi:hypothetical protein